MQEVNDEPFTAAQPDEPVTTPVVIHGRPGVGKTTHAAALARHFGCRLVVDDWNGVDPLPPDALALTNAQRIMPPRRAIVIRFDVAMQEAGLVSAASLL